MGHGHLDGHRNIDNRLALGRRTPDVENRVANLQRIFRLGSGEALRRIFESIVRPGFFRQLFEELRAVDGNLANLVFRHAEHLLTLGERCRIVDVDDSVFNALQGLKGLFDNMLPRLRQDLNGNVGRNKILLHQPPQKFVFGIRSRGKADFNLLKADRDQHLVELDLLLKAHGNDQRLIAVPQINAAPDRRMLRILLLRPAQIANRRQIIAFLILRIILHENPSSSILQQKSPRLLIRDEGLTLAVPLCFASLTRPHYGHLSYALLF